jgi:hypothetical protein
MTKFPPFGITYSGDSVTVNLRIHPTKFFAVTLEKYKAHRLSKNGYVLFNMTFHKESDELHHFYQCKEEMEAIKLPAK